MNESLTAALNGLDNYDFRNQHEHVATLRTDIAELEANLDALHGMKFSDRNYHALKSRAEAAEAQLAECQKDAALAILAAQPRTSPPFALSENAMLYLVQKSPPKGYGLPYTVHGFRSSFRDWCSEETDTPREVAEMALAHTIADKTEAAYRRGHLLDKRRALMAEWGTYLT